MWYWATASAYRALPWTLTSGGWFAASDGPRKPTRTRSKSQSVHSFHPRTGPSCATTSSGMADGAAMCGTPRAAPARSLAGAPRTGKERPTRSRQPSWFGSREDDEGAWPDLRPAVVENSALVGNSSCRSGGCGRKLRTGRKFDLDAGEIWLLADSRRRHTRGHAGWLQRVADPWRIPYASRVTNRGVTDSGGDSRPGLHEESGRHC